MLHKLMRFGVSIHIATIILRVKQVGLNTLESFNFVFSHLSICVGSHCCVIIAIDCSSNHKNSDV